MLYNVMKCDPSDQISIISVEGIPRGEETKEESTVIIAGQIRTINSQDALQIVEAGEECKQNVQLLT